MQCHVVVDIGHAARAESAGGQEFSGIVVAVSLLEEVALEDFEYTSPLGMSMHIDELPGFPADQDDL